MPSFAASVAAAGAPKGVVENKVPVGKAGAGKPASKQSEAVGAVARVALKTASKENERPKAGASAQPLSNRTLQRRPLGAVQARVSAGTGT